MARCPLPDVPALQSAASHRHPERPSGQIWPDPSKYLCAKYTRPRFGNMSIITERSQSQKAMVWAVPEATKLNMHIPTIVPSFLKGP